AGTGRTVVSSYSQGLKQCIASEFWHEVAGEPTDRSESRRAGARRAGTPLVVIAVADDADAKSLLEGVMQQPFERTPARMYLDGALDPPVVSIFHIGVAAADMRDDSTVLGLERLEQVIRGVDCVRRGLTFDQDVRRAADRPALVPIEDVTVAAHPGVARPFVSRQANKSSGLVQVRGEPVELRPECVGDLEVVALMADHVDERRIARIAEIGL